ncbi:MAG: hypothetical protein SNH79_05325 [Rikenellaceae bacterium]
MKDTNTLSTSTMFYCINKPSPTIYLKQKTNQQLQQHCQREKISLRNNTQREEASNKKIPRKNIARD